MKTQYFHTGCKGQIIKVESVVQVIFRCEKCGAEWTAKEVPDSDIITNWVLIKEGGK
jgi:hypothetical protein